MIKKYFISVYISFFIIYPRGCNWKIGKTSYHHLVFISSFSEKKSDAQNKILQIDFTQNAFCVVLIHKIITSISINTPRGEKSTPWRNKSKENKISCDKLFQTITYLQ